MKIRTDFVTNSSSSSYITVQVRNQVLYELLRDYKKKLGLKSVSKETIALIPFNNVEDIGRDTDCPASFDQAVSEIWNILDSCAEKCPELQEALNNARTDILSCYSDILFTKGYHEWGGDSDLRYDWSYPKDTKQEDIDCGAVEEGVYFYYANLGTGEAFEKMGKRYHAGNVFGFWPTSHFTVAYIEKQIPVVRKFTVDKVSVSKIAAKYRKPKQEAVIAVAESSGSNRCAGMTFVITGGVNRFKNRDEFTQYVKTQGGKVSSSVSAKTDYLVNNDSASNSSKNCAAKQFGIPVITEEQFIDRFGFPE